MGHGRCVTYNKQSSLVGPDGSATSDPRVIGSLSWRLLRTLNIPPHELRGISIQLQKFDAHPAPGQVRLPFRPAPNPTTASTSVGPAPKARAPSSGPVTVQPEPPKAPAAAAAGAALPSFSQVDMSVFEALPEDIRKELEAEYRRSAPAPNTPLDPIPRANSAMSARGKLRDRGAGAVSSRGARDQARRAASVLRPRGRGRGRGDGGGQGLLAFPPALVVQVKPGELVELGIDAEVFSALPVRIQREQLAVARGARVRPSQQPVQPKSPLRPLQRLEGKWAPAPGPHEYIPPPPPPRARFAEAERPGLRRGDAQAVDGVDVRRVVRVWVERFVWHVPHAEDVALVGGYLVRCVATDVGAERAVGVMRWWGALLRRRWALWEHADERDEEPEPGEDIRAEVVGMAWWRAYREVGDSLNEVVRKRFGGSLRFR